MANYVKAVDFASKDALLSGDPAKIIKGSEIDTEYNAISVAISTKADTVSPTFTGTPTAPTASPGTNTTQVATTAFVGAAVTAATGSLGTMSTQNANNVAITGGSITGITDLAVADGGTGASTAANARTNLGVPATDGTGASGNWNINAATVTNGVYTTSFTSGNQSLSQSGYQKLPGGLIIQWGRNNPGATVTFPIAFPTACFSVAATAGSNFEEFVNTITATSFFLGTNGSSASCPWIAVGH
jgi:hypothetical protein